MNLVTGLGVVYVLAESDDDCNEVGMIMMILMMTRVRRVGFFNFGSGRVRVLKKYFGSGRVLGICIKYQVIWELWGN